MSSATDVFEAKIVDILAGTSVTAPAAIYCACFTAVADDEAGTVTEVSTSGTAYARLAVTFAAGSQVSGKYTRSNSADLTYSQATASWGTVTHWGLNSSSSGAGTWYIIETLTASKTVASGDTFKIPTGSLVVNTA